MDRIDEITLLAVIFTIAFGAYSVRLLYLRVKHVPIPAVFKRGTYGYKLQQRMRSTDGIVSAIAMTVSMLTNVLFHIFRYKTPGLSYALVGVSFVALIIASTTSLRILSGAKPKSTHAKRKQSDWTNLS